MPKSTKAAPRNAWEDTYFPDADVSDNVNDTAHVSNNASAHVADYDSAWRPVGVRVRGAELAAFDRFARTERLKKGPTLTALLQMLMAGDIDVQAVRERVRALRDAAD